MMRMLIFDLPRVLKRAGRTLSMAANFIAAFVVIFGLGPAIESSVAPILTGQAVTDIERSDNLVCWRWSFTKSARRARLVEADLKIETPQGDLVDATALVKEPRGLLRYVRASQTSPGDGLPHHRVLCADLGRAQIPPNEQITMRLTMVYKTATPWRIRHAAPVFVVAPVPPLPAD